MLITRGFRSEIVGGSLLLGSFDGFHLGHVSLLSEAQSPKRIVSLYPHPLVTLGRIPDYKRVTSLHELASVLAAHGVAALHQLHFSTALAQCSAELFLQRLITAFAPEELVVGEDARVGRNGEGDVTLMAKILQALGVRLRVVPFLSNQNQKISSRRIREELISGRVSNVTALLGRAYELQGRVIHGEKRGQLIGFPTANFGGIKQLLPNTGVYVTEIARRGEDRWQRAVTNIGTRPTVGGVNLSVETHILSHQTFSLYGSWMKLRFLHRLRQEQKFNSIDELRRQINEDVKQASEYGI